MNLATAIVDAVRAKRSCEETGDTVFAGVWTDRLEELRELLPSGSGIDAGTRIEEESTADKRLVLRTAYHHMNDVGMYDRWTEHRVTVTPGFHGLEIKVSGLNHNDVKDYLADLFEDALSQECDQSIVHLIPARG